MLGLKLQLDKLKFPPEPVPFGMHAAPTMAQGPGPAASGPAGEDDTCALYHQLIRSKDVAGPPQPSATGSNQVQGQQQREGRLSARGGAGGASHQNTQELEQKLASLEVSVWGQVGENVLDHPVMREGASARQLPLPCKPMHVMRFALACVDTTGMPAWTCVFRKPG